MHISVVQCVFIVNQKECKIQQINFNRIFNNNFEEYQESSFLLEFFSKMMTKRSILSLLLVCVSTICNCLDMQLLKYDTIYSKCEQEHISLIITFSQAFEGVIYAKDFYGNPNCGSPNMEISSSNKIAVNISFLDCKTNIRRINRKAQAMNTIVFQFHPLVKTIRDFEEMVTCDIDYLLSKDFFRSYLKRTELPPKIFDAKLDIMSGRQLFGEEVASRFQISNESYLVLYSLVHELRVRKCYAHTEFIDISPVFLLDDNACVRNPTLEPLNLKYNESDYILKDFSKLQNNNFATKDGIYYVTCAFDLCRDLCEYFCVKETEVNKLQWSYRLTQQIKVKNTVIQSRAETADKIITESDNGVQCNKVGLKFDVNCYSNKIGTANEHDKIITVNSKSKIDVEASKETFQLNTEIIDFSNENEIVRELDIDELDKSVELSNSTSDFVAETESPSDSDISFSSNKYSRNSLNSKPKISADASDAFRLKTESILNISNEIVPELDVNESEKFVTLSDSKNVSGIENVSASELNISFIPKKYGRNIVTSMPKISREALEDFHMTTEITSDVSSKIVPELDVEKSGKSMEHNNSTKVFDTEIKNALDFSISSGLNEYSGKNLFSKNLMINNTVNDVNSLVNANVSFAPEEHGGVLSVSFIKFTIVTTVLSVVVFIMIVLYCFIIVFHGKKIAHQAKDLSLR